eukprot:SAG25_NODE_9106_length_387_cov_1.243056_1_plen_49_part_10
MWDNGEPAVTCTYLWRQLSKDLLKAATFLGYTEPSWNEEVMDARHTLAA